MPESPDIDHLIRAELIEQRRRSAPGMTESERQRAADAMITFGKREGRRIRRESASGLNFHEVTLHTNDDEGTGRIISVKPDATAGPVLDDVAQGIHPTYDSQLNRRYRFGPGGVLESVEPIGPRTVPDPVPPIGVRTMIKARIARWRRRHV